MTVIGRDRPGLVDAVARLVVGHGGNWLESRMCQLGGEFAGILRVSVPAEQEAALGRDLEQLKAQGLTVVARASRVSETPEAGRLARFEIVGQDRPGIVHQISSALANQAVNVEELNTECISAPMSGETLFKAEAKVHVPASCDMVRLRAELEKIASDLLVDFTFEEIHS
jgi:glycine cleavage system regulatory protein